MEKMVKNGVEIQGMRNCHERDAVTLCDFSSWFEKEVSSRNVTEAEAAGHAEACRKKQTHFDCLGFDTISSTGPDGALIHYEPAPETDKLISVDELYLIDSGAQYLDGTTDIARKTHLGTPWEYEKECFTSLLKGHIASDTAGFSNDTKGIFLDNFIFIAYITTICVSGHSWPSLCRNKMNYYNL